MRSQFAGAFARLLKDFARGEKDLSKAGVGGAADLALAGPDPVQCGDRVVRQVQFGGGRFSRRWATRRRAGNQQDIGRAVQQPGERDLHRRGAEPLGDLGQRRRLQRREAAEREERHIGDAVAGEVVDQGIVGAVRHVVVSARRRSRRCRRPSAICAAVTLLSPMWRTRPCRCSSARTVSGASIEPSAGPWTVDHDPQIDHLQHVEAEIAQIVVHRRRSVPRARRPGAMRLRAAPGADLGDDDEIVGIGMQRLADDLVGDVRAIEIAGVDVVDAARHRLAQHRDRGVAILGRAEHARARRAAWRRSPGGSRCGRRGGRCRKSW